MMKIISSLFGFVYFTIRIFAEILINLISFFWFDLPVKCLKSYYKFALYPNLDDDTIEEYINKPGSLLEFFHGGIIVELVLLGVIIFSDINRMYSLLLLVFPACFALYAIIKRKGV